MGKLRSWYLPRGHLRAPSARVFSAITRPSLPLWHPDSVLPSIITGVL